MIFTGLENLKKKELPFVPLKGVVIFPHMIFPFFTDKKESISAIDKAMKQDRTLLAACQKNPVNNPAESDLYHTGTICRILQTLKLPDGSLRILIQGKLRAKITSFSYRKSYSSVFFRIIKDDKKITKPISTLMKTVILSFKNYIKFHKRITPEAIDAIEKAGYPDKLIDLIAAQMVLKIPAKIKILEEEKTAERLENFAVLLESENEVFNIQQQIQSRVRRRIQKKQKEHFLNEQLKEINKELGNSIEDSTGIGELETRLETKKLPEMVKNRVSRELKRLKKLQAFSPESGIIRTYLEWIADLPWEKQSMENINIKKAAKILDNDHYNMKKAKERILDFIAVRQLQKEAKGPILCFIGPPGTGKTSLGRSVARALGREFVRVSLGGIRDEAEIRGHRKTYVGALPGKIIQSIKKVNSINPVFLLDEIDKMNSDFRGDPASALLEVLDPEQNNSFSDHYLEVQYDLSNVMFIATGNSIHNIPYPLLDRMEIIEIPGYTEFEKYRIASEFIIPKQLKENGLEWAEIRFQKQAVIDIIRNYTMESGVRNLEREIAHISRKIAREIVQGGKIDRGTPLKIAITPRNIHKYLGKKKFTDNLVSKELKPGMAYGLAWTERGGTLLPVEVVIFEGTGELILTGNLGDVMKESARTALSFLRANQKKLDLKVDFYKNKDIHIHVPEGGIPKDGPSAGITLTTALLSAFRNKPVRKGISMTGEITLTGRILQVGGTKEKILAAHRNKMTTVLMPEQNKKDIKELPEEVLSSIEFLFFNSSLKALKSIFQ